MPNVRPHATERTDRPDLPADRRSDQFVHAATGNADVPRYLHAAGGYVHAPTAGRGRWYGRSRPGLRRNGHGDGWRHEFVGPARDAADR